jgi:hypothetical protein
MADLLSIAFILAFFAASLGLVSACQQWLEDEEERA